MYDIYRADPLKTCDSVTPTSMVEDECQKLVEKNVHSLLDSFADAQIYTPPHPL